MKRLLIVPLVAVLFCGVGLAKQARAATLAGPAAQWYQQWLAADKMPQPKGTINIVRGQGAQSVASIEPDGTAQITLGDDPRFVNRGTFYHELGHIYDQRNLSDLARQRFRGIMHDQRPYGAPGARNNGEPNPPREQFAEAYRLLALHPWAADSRRGWQRLMRYQQDDPNARRAVADYGFAPTYFQLRKIAKLIQTLG